MLSEDIVDDIARQDAYVKDAERLQLSRILEKEKDEKREGCWLEDSPKPIKEVWSLIVFIRLQRKSGVKTKT